MNHIFPALSFGFWKNVTAISPYTKKIYVNFRLDGNPNLMAGNVNQLSINYATGTVPRNVYSNLIEFAGGATTNITMDLTDLGTAMDITADASSSTNFGANAYIRGCRVINGDAISVLFDGVGIPNDAPYRITAACFITTSVTATEDGVIEVTNGASTITEAINCTVPTESSQIEALANSSGQINFTLTANAGAANGVGICCLLLEI